MFCGVVQCHNQALALTLRGPGGVANWHKETIQLQLCDAHQSILKYITGFHREEPANA